MLVGPVSRYGEGTDRWSRVMSLVGQGDLRAGTAAKLGEDVRHVGFDRAPRHLQPCRDIRVGQPAGDEFGDPEPGRGQCLPPGGLASTYVVRGAAQPEGTHPGLGTAQVPRGLEPGVRFGGRLVRGPGGVEVTAPGEQDCEVLLGLGTVQDEGVSVCALDGNVCSFPSLPVVAYDSRKRDACAISG